MRAEHRVALAAACTAALAGGCTEKVAGEWVSPDSHSYYGSIHAPNRMTLGSDGSGKAEVRYVVIEDPSGQVYRDRFEIDWEERGDGHYAMTMSCFASDQLGTPCDGQSFTMQCDQGGKGSRLDCTGDAKWVSYQFAWEQQ